MSKQRVCFYRHYAYPLFDMAAQGQFGGAEVRAVTFARELADRGHFDVCFAVDTAVPRPPRRIGNIEVHFQDQRPHRHRLPTGRWTVPWPASAACRLARSLRKRLGYPSLEALRFLSEVGADVYCCFGANVASAEIIHAARHTAAKSMLFLISDAELDTAWHPRVARRKAQRRLGQARRLAFELADEIVVQSSFQQEKVQRRYARSSVLIRNPISLGRPSGPRPDLPPRFALWVGRSDHHTKRPDLCFELARACSHIPFVVVMNKVDPPTHAAICQLAPPNVRLVEQVPYAQIESYFEAATVVLNTSPLEGFPNTFLQAAKYGVPILSLVVDPDGMLERHGCGQTASGDPGQMARRLQEIWRGGPHIARMSAAARHYVAEYHDLSQRALELQQLIERMAPRGHRQVA